MTDKKKQKSNLKNYCGSTPHCRDCQAIFDKEPFQIKIREEWGINYIKAFAELEEETFI